MKVRVAIVAFWVIAHVATAQRGIDYTEERGKWTVYTGIVATRYHGDLSETWNFRHLQLGAGITVGTTSRLNEIVSVRAESRLYYVYANQIYTRNAANYLTFASINPDAWVGLQFDLLPIDANKQNIPMLWIGTGFTYISPATRFQNRYVSLPPIRTENTRYSRFVPIITYGASLPANLSKRQRLCFDVSYTHALTDYLDDVSTIYVNKSTAPLRNAQITDRRIERRLTPNPPGVQRGNPRRNDGYFTIGVRYVHLL